MAGSVNKAIVVGNLGMEPDVRALGSGDKVANLRIATSESWKDKATGERKEQTEWHSVSVFGPTAEFISQYVHKGDKVYVEGQLATRKYTDKDGNERYTTEIKVTGWRGQVVLLASKESSGSRRDADDDVAPTPTQTQKRYQQQKQLAEDDIPF